MHGTKSPSQTAFHLFPAAISSIFFLYPSSPTGHAPNPLPPTPTDVVAIARTLHAPPQLYSSARVNLCPYLQAIEHFFLITVVFHIVFYVFFCIMLNTQSPFLPL